MQKTNIEYLTHVWNPVAMRCDRVSAGCDNCWHLRMSNRHAGNHQLRPELREARAGGDFALLESELAAPLRLRKPAVIGVQFMGDLFHSSVPDEWINQVIVSCLWARLQSRPVTFVILTKRPQRMWTWFAQRTDGSLFAKAEWARMACGTPLAGLHDVMPWPNAAIVLGVSVENQATADERIPWLLRTPAAKRVASYEPALGAVDFAANHTAAVNAAMAPRQILDWVIAGAETGPGKRSADTQWFRDVRDQCSAAGVPFFFKRDSDGNRELDSKMHEEMIR